MRRSIVQPFTSRLLVVGKRCQSTEATCIYVADQIPCCVQKPPSGLGGFTVSHGLLFNSIGMHKRPACPRIAFRPALVLFYRPRLRMTTSSGGNPNGKARRLKPILQRVAVRLLVYGGVGLLIAYCLIGVRPWFPHAPIRTPQAEEPAPADPGWPHFRGPDYNARSAETGLADSWPADGPPVLWAKEIGRGFSGLIAVGRRVYTQTQTLTAQVVLASTPTPAEPFGSIATAGPTIRRACIPVRGQRRPGMRGGSISPRRTAWSGASTPTGSPCGRSMSISNSAGEAPILATLARPWSKTAK